LWSFQRVLKGTGYGEQVASTSWQCWNLLLRHMIMKTTSHSQERLRGMQGTDSKMKNPTFRAQTIERLNQVFCKFVVDWYFPADYLNLIDVLYVDENELILLLLWLRRILGVDDTAWNALQAKWGMIVGSCIWQTGSPSIYKILPGVYPRLMSSNNGAVMKVRKSQEEIHLYLQTESCSGNKRFLAMKEKASICFLAYLSSRICSKLFANFEFGSCPSKPLMQPPA